MIPSGTMNFFYITAKLLRCLRCTNSLFAQYMAVISWSTIRAARSVRIPLSIQLVSFIIYTGIILLLTLIKLLSFAITDLRTWSDLMLKYLSENKHEGNVMCFNNWSANNLPNQLCHLLPSYVFLNFDYRLGICDCLRALVDCSASRRKQGLPPLPMIPSEDADKALLDIKLPEKSPMYANPLCPRGRSYLKHFALCETCHINNVHPVLVVRHAAK